MSKDKIFVGSVIHCDDDGQLLVHKNAQITVVDGKITNFAINDQGKTANGFSNSCTNIEYLKDNQFIIPGFVDGHVHAVQFPNLGIGYDKPLLDWLDTYTMPMEKKFNDAKFADLVFDSVVKRTLKMGTTTACYFASLYDKASLILAEKVVQYGQRALVGKVNMNVPQKNGYSESLEASIQDTIKFINNVKNLKNPLVKPIITPRFALSCDLELMKKLSSIAKQYDLHIQTHISEHPDEVKAVESIFNTCSSYAGVYETAGLLTNKTVLAHGIHLSDSELEIIRNKESSVIHCPSSNTCLKSGLCDVKRLQNANIKVGLGTDVSGGNLPSLVEVMRNALQVSTHLSLIKPKYNSLNYKDVFYLATLGGAKALDLGNEIGNFKVGKEFDALVIDLDSSESSLDNLIDYSLEEKLQRFIYSGDDRNIVQVYVSGKLVSTQ